MKKALALLPRLHAAFQGWRSLRELTPGYRLRSLRDRGNEKVVLCGGAEIAEHH